MRLTRVTASDFRCFRQLDMAPGPKINLISGDNASGKTSVLEGIFMLGRGQSFRSATLGPQILMGAEKFLLAGHLQNETGQSRRIGMLRPKKGKLSYKLDSQSETKRFDLVSALPLQVIDPNLHRLLEQGPKYRRSFLDWGVFHVEHRFFSAWRQYRRALKQRNRAIRNNAGRQAIEAWNPELIRTAAVITESREHYLQQLSRMLPETTLSLLGKDTPQISYHTGWSRGSAYSDSLESSLESDRKSGYTQVGPHRADVSIRAAGVRARTHVSRGQQKLLVSAMLLAQARLMFEATGAKPVLLVDDLMAELGPTYLNALLVEIRDLDVQCFITALDRTLIGDALHDAHMFHVEHGQVIAG